MSTITKELAKLFRKITNSEIDAEGNAHVVLSPADSLLINNARIALASLEAEAVACIDQANLDYLESGDATVWPETSADAGDVLLYTAPQPLTTSERAELENYRNAQQVVPDASVMADNHISWLNENFPRKTFTDEEWEEVSLYTWLAWRDACRAAMLQGKADGNSPVIQEGWVACSERMPGHSKTFLALTAFGEYWTGYFDRTDVFWCDETKVENVTHWMPLPAAPQQEAE